MTTRGEAYDTLLNAEYRYLLANGWTPKLEQPGSWVTPKALAGHKPGKAYEHAHAVNVQKAADRALYRR